MFLLEIFPLVNIVKDYIKNIFRSNFFSFLVILPFFKMYHLSCIVLITSKNKNYYNKFDQFVFIIISKSMLYMILTIAIINTTSLQQ